MAEVVFIINPAAGRGRVGQMQAQLEAALRPVPQAQLCWTQAPHHATELARQAPDGCRVVAVGGDGTLHEVLKGMAHTHKTLGIVPIGSGNDFARTVGVRGLSLEAAIQTAAFGPVQAFDLGEVNGEPFGNSFGAGFDAQVSHLALSAPSFLRGLPRYLYSIVGTLQKLKLPQLQLKADNQTLFEGPSLLSAYMIGRTYGAGIPVAPFANPSDGRLAVVVAGSFSRLGVLGILPRLLLGRHLSHPQVKRFEGTHFSLHFDRPVEAHTDGELLGQPQQVYQVRIYAGGLRVAVGASPLA
jgi:YegS/Rv2252/BmrU family lipid kinase